MSIALIIPDRKLDDLQHKLQLTLPDTKIEIWPDISQPEQVTFAVVWKQPFGSLTTLPALKAIQCFGAGVDAILADPQLPAVPVSRIVDPDLTHSMVQYLQGVVSYYQLRLDQFAAQQRQQLWKPKRQRNITKLCVLGLGELGMAVARHFAQAGFTVDGWSRSPKKDEKIRCFTEQQGLQTAITDADVIICLLPLTAETDSLLNAAFFQTVTPGAILINVARGAIVDDIALLNALDSGQLQAACLDVFRQEPLPKENALWHHPAVLITPHISAVTNVTTVIEQIVVNYRRSERGQTLHHEVDTKRGY